MFRNYILNTLLFIPHYYDTREPTDFQVPSLHNKFTCGYKFTKMKNKYYLNNFVFSKTYINNFFKVFK